jgi:hypothetical protein
MTTTEKVAIKHTHRQQRFVLFVISLRILFSRAGLMTDRAMGTRTDAFGPEQAGAWWHSYTRWQTTMSNSAFSI